MVAACLHHLVDPVALLLGGRNVGPDRELEVQPLSGRSVDRGTSGDTTTAGTRTPSIMKSGSTRPIGESGL
jgi:hypothetical protein